MCVFQNEQLNPEDPSLQRQIEQLGVATTAKQFNLVSIANILRTKQWLCF